MKHHGAVQCVLAGRDGGLGLTTPKMRALAVLSVIEGPSIRELAVYSVVEQSTLSRALDQLDAEGQVRREADSADSVPRGSASPRRAARAFEALWPRMAEANARMFRGIPEEERRAFVGTLQKMLTTSQARDLNAAAAAPWRCRQ